MRNLTLALSAVLLLPAAAFAGGFALPNTYSRDLAMGGSAVAFQTGPEANVDNTAALAGQEGLGISLGGTIIHLRSTWTDTAGTTGAAASETTIPKASFPPNFNVAYGGRLGNGMGWGAGLSVSVPAGGLIHWPAGWAGDTQIQSVNRRVIAINLGVAFQPIEQVKIGVAGVYLTGSENLVQALDFLGSEGQAQLQTKGSGTSFTASAEITPAKAVPLRIGVHYRHQAVLKLEGSAHFVGVPPPFQVAGGLYDQNVKHTLTLPNNLDIGVSYDAMPDLTLNLAYTWWRWEVYAKDVFEGDLGTTIDVAHDFTNVSTFRFGGEYRGVMEGKLKLQFGLLRDITPQPLETLAPSLPTSSVWATSLGAAYQIMPTFEVNAGWQHAFYDEPTVLPGGEAFPGTYNTAADVFSLALLWRMK